MQAVFTTAKNSCAHLPCPRRAHSPDRARARPAARTPSPRRCPDVPTGSSRPRGAGIRRRRAGRWPARAWPRRCSRRGSCPPCAPGSRGRFCRAVAACLHAAGGPSRKAAEAAVTAAPTGRAASPCAYWPSPPLRLPQVARIDVGAVVRAGDPFARHVGSTVSLAGRSGS